MAAPVFTGLNNNPTFTENSTVVLLDNSVTVSDADFGPSDPFTGATLTLARVGGANADDLFSGNGLADGQVTVPGTIPDPDDPGQFLFVDIVIGSYVADSGVLIITFNENATGARINDVLPGLTYANASDTPPASVVVRYTFNDGEVATGSITVTINQVNDAPSLDFVNPSAFFQPGSSGAILSPVVQLSDLDSPTLNRATVSFVGGFLGSDALTVNVGSTGITASYTGGVLTLSGIATVDQYRQVLQTVTYTSSSADPTNAGANLSRDLRWQIRDSSNDTSNVTDIDLEFAPTVDLDASAAGFDFSTTFAKGGAAVTIADSDANITVNAFQSISSVTVVLTNAKAGDTLSATSGPLDVAIDNSQAGLVTLVISGSGSEAQYESALKSATFGNAGAIVDPTARNLTVVVADDNYPSLTAHSTVTITGAGTNAPNDFDKSGTNDLLWRHNNGTFTEWQSTGSGVTPNVVVNSSVDNSWRAEGSFDFSGDSRADLLWRNIANGQFTIWNSTGNNFTPNSYVNGTVNNSWSVAALADFDGNGKSDLLFRHTNGTFTEWQSTGSGFTPNVYVNGAVDNSWHLVAANDFSGDGKADLLWRHNNGTFTQWNSTGNSFTPNAVVNSSVDPTWHVIGAGDFNGDGKTDLLFRHNNGTFTEWQSTGNGFTPNVYVNSSVDNSWQLAQIGDFNGDGKEDLLWRNSSGTFTEWQSTGNSFTPNVVVSNAVGADWALVTQHHYDLI